MAAHYLVLGSDQGWHANQLRQGARAIGAKVTFAAYESLSARLGSPIGSSEVVTLRCDAGLLSSFDAVLTRTMPAGSLERITFRLAVLHAAVRSGLRVVNPPAALEMAIDKFATLAEVQRLGFPVPPTLVVQDRVAAMRGFETLGGDCVVKPIFGGEGRGVMRVGDRELAWTVFGALEQIDSIAYVQQFVPPGGRDLRLLVIGDQVHAIRRTCDNDFRTNVVHGAKSERVDVDDALRLSAQRITSQFGLTISSVDLLQGPSPDELFVVEVNAIPGWRAAQSVIDEHLGTRIMASL